MKKGAWTDPYWVSDPKGGRHSFRLCEYKDEILAAYQTRYPNHPDIGAVFVQRPSREIVWQCSVCGWVILQYDGLGSIVTPLPSWGPHCKARVVKSVVED
jgi:hypothetical protein